jgi:hypothetical protein
MWCCTDQDGNPCALFNDTDSGVLPSENNQLLAAQIAADGQWRCSIGFYNFMK